MTSNDSIVEAAKREQQRMFRIACDPRRFNLTRKAIEIDAEIPRSTLASYADGRALMTIATLRSLCGVIPNELLSLLLPEGYAVVSTPEAVDHDAVASWCIQFLAKWNAAKHPESEAGTETGPRENDELLAAIVQLQSAA